MLKFKIVKGDTVRVISGKDKGKIGKVVKVLRDKMKLIVSGVNIALKHRKATQSNEAGIVKQELPIHISNVSHIDPKSGDVTKVGYRVDDKGQKVRFAKKSNEIILKEGK